MDRKRLVWILVGLGVVLLALSALADPIGVGEGDGIGWKQVVGMIAGGALAVTGLVLARRAGGVVTDTADS